MIWKQVFTEKKIRGITWWATLVVSKGGTKRWRWHLSPEHWYVSTKLKGAISQKPTICVCLLQP
jgi:hypothetical protein